MESDAGGIVTVAQAVQQREGMRNPRKGLLLTSAVHSRKGQDDRHPEGKQLRWRKQPAQRGCVLCCSEPRRWYSPAVSSRSETKQKHSAAPANTTLTSLGTQKRDSSTSPSPLGLIHFFWHFKISKSHHEQWVTAREMWDRSSPEGRTGAVEWVTHLHPVTAIPAHPSVQLGRSPALAWLFAAVPH